MKYIQKKILIIASVCLCLSVAIAWGQEDNSQNDDQWYLGKRISAFEFLGLKTISRVDMNNVLSEYKNKEFSQEILFEIQNVIYELEYFDEIIPEAQRGIRDQLVLLFTVIEKPTIAKINFEGNKVVGRSVLQGALTMRRGDIFNDFKADEEIKVLRGKYFEQGYPEVGVSYRTEITNKNKNELDVIFEITEGIKIVISEINIEGNEVFKDNKLKRVISSKKRTLTRKGTFSDVILEDDKILIVQEYYKKGYIDANVVDIIVEKSEDPKSKGDIQVVLTYIIKEGNLYTFDEINFEGNDIYTREELQALFPLKKGDIMDLTKFQRGYDRMRLRYADQGFIFNSFEYEEIRNTDTNSIAFLIKIGEFGQSHIENIILNGNVKTKDYVIYRSLGIREGDVFSSSGLNYARLNLMSLRYFRSVIPDSRPGSAPGLIDLIFNLEEDFTRNIQFGATFGGSSEFPVSLFLSWIQPNLVGRGLILSVKGTASPYEQTISTSFTEPRVFSTPFSLSTSVAFSHEQVNNVPQDILSPNFDADDQNINYDPYTGHYVFTSTKIYKGITYSAGDPFPGTPTDDEIADFSLARDTRYYGSTLTSVYNNSLMEYENYRLGFSVGTGYVYNTPFGKFGTSVSVGPKLNYVYYDKTVYRPADVQVRKNLENWKIYNILSWKGYFDSRDLSYIPSKGAYLSQEFNMYGGLLFGDSHFIRSTSVVEGHVKLLDWPVAENWSWKIVLAGQSVFTAIMPQFYYPEGTNYEENGPSYVQRLDLNGLYNSRGWPRVRNGEATWNNWLELRMPMYETVVWWDQFIEVSRLWTNLEDVGVQDNPTEYQFTAGTGFRFVLQQFPIRVYVAKRFKLDEDYSPVWQTGNLAGSGATVGSGLDLIFTLGIDFF